MAETRVKKGDVVRYVLEESGIPEKKEAVMVGDREHDILGAKENGLDSVRLRRQRRIRTGRSRLDCGNGRRIKESAFDYLEDKRSDVKRRYDNENRHYPHTGFIHGNAGAF